MRHVDTDRNAMERQYCAASSEAEKYRLSRAEQVGKNPPQRKRKTRNNKPRTNHQILFANHNTITVHSFGIHHLNGITTT